jgi:hypothetical protein
MTGFNRTIERYVCPNCGLNFEVTKEPVPFVRAGPFDGIACTTEILAWSGDYDYTAWKALPSK